MTLKKTITFACVAILIANLLLVLLSWIISAIGVAGVRSLISSEGLRWFLSRYVDIIATPLLAWLLLLSIAYSCYEGSGLSLALCRAMKGEKLEFKQRLGIRVALIVLVVIIANTLLLLLTPHAVLLSPSGDIFPSPFSKSIVPIVAGAVSLVSFAYGLAGGTINNIDTAFKTLYCRLPSLLPVLILYIFAAQLYACICFVF